MLNNILIARENRSLLKKKRSEAQKASFSFSLNIPGYPKSTPNITAFFNIVLSDLLNFMSARLIELTDRQELLDDAGNYFLASIHSAISPEEIKSFCEIYEESHALGRFIDVDICDEQGQYISSGKNKACFFCGNDTALNCMRAQRHNFEELRAFQEKQIQKYLNDCRCMLVAKQLASYAMQSILYEITLSPKPGLVDFQTSGAHKDMDYFTFIDSSAAIFPYFQELATLGFTFEGEMESGLPLIRKVGLQMEHDMFMATNGINTQKGNIFLMGIALFASAYIIAREGKFDIFIFSAISAKMGATLMDEYDMPTDKKTHGHICVEKYGKKIAGGARFEVANGFSTVINYGLPLLNDYHLTALNTQEKQSVLLDVLLSLMANNNDTNILYRSCIETLVGLKRIAQKTLNSTSVEEKQENFQNLTRYCSEHNISPGGSADLLAVVVYLHLLNSANFIKS